MLALPIEQLEQIGVDLMNFTGSKDLADWLQRFADPSEPDTIDCCGDQK
jgi:phosphopantetheinyl transferase